MESLWRTAAAPPNAILIKATCGSQSLVLPKTYEYGSTSQLDFGVGMADAEGWHQDIEPEEETAAVAQAPDASGERLPTLFLCP